MATAAERTRAVDAVQNALASGKLTRPTRCQACHRQVRLQAHHYKGYDKHNLLTVRWLCRRCHGLSHNKLHGVKPWAKAKFNGSFECPICHQSTVVIDSRPLKGNEARRPRLCAKGHRFTTYESVRLSQVETGWVLGRLLKDATSSVLSKFIEQTRPRNGETNEQR